MTRQRLASMFLMCGIVMALVGGTQAWAGIREYMKCWDVYVPPFAHGCNCFGDPNTMTDYNWNPNPSTNDPHWSDYCRNALPLDSSNSTAKSPMCVDVYIYPVPNPVPTCFETSGVYPCGDVFNCLGYKCDTGWPALSDCQPTTKGACTKTHGTCTSGT